MSRIDDAAQAFQQGRVMSGAVHKANCERDHYKEQYEIIAQKWIDYKDRCAELEQIIADAPHEEDCGSLNLVYDETLCDCWKSKVGDE